MKAERFMSKPIYVDVLRYVENDRSDVFVFTGGKQISLYLVIQSN